jgi:hypothetical protein
MEECDYCGATFESESAYVEHLADEHEGELGRIDRRRVAAADDGGGGQLLSGRVLVAAGAVLVLAAAVYFGVLPGGNGGPDVEPDGIEAQSLPDSGDQALLADVEEFPDQGNAHVSVGEDVEYERFPPLSGPHDPNSLPGGFYESEQRVEQLVHNLEHGHVVVYYDPAALNDSAEESLKEFAAAQNGNWAAVVAVPNPRDDPESAFILTAWTVQLRMDSYDNETVRAFLAEYIGRGPENPVR